MVDVNSEAGHKAIKTLGNEYGNDHVVFVKANVTSRNEYEGNFNIVYYFSGKNNTNNIQSVLCNDVIFSVQIFLYIGYNDFGERLGNQHQYLFIKRNNK